MTVRRYLAIALTVAAATLLASPAPAVGIKDKAICPLGKTGPYVGTYRWRGGGPAQQVRFWFERVEARGDGKLVVTGRGVYLPPPNRTNITIRAAIDRRTGRIEIWESNPDQAGFTTDGSHVGTISAGFCAIEAVWTSKGSGSQGDLVLRIRK